MALLMLIDKLTPRYKITYISAMIISILCYMILYWTGMNTLAVVSLFTSLYVLYPIIELLKKNEKSLLKKVTAAFYMVTILMLFLRFISTFFSFNELSLLISSPIKTLSFISLLVIMIGSTFGFVLMAKEKTDQELLNAAMNDGLTGILNRRTFISLAEKGLSFAIRKRETCSFILIDIDFFKKINDTYGHAAGDNVLVDFAKKTGANLRNYDIFGRYGGEEFAVFLQGVDVESAIHVAEKLRAVTEQSSMNSISYTISIGLSNTDKKNKSLNDLYQEADIALYQAKKTGRNRVVVFKEDKLTTSKSIQ